MARVAGNEREAPGFDIKHAWVAAYVAAGILLEEGQDWRPACHAP